MGDDAMPLAFVPLGLSPAAHVNAAIVTEAPDGGLGLNWRSG
jgi:hypothetical protein